MQIGVAGAAWFTIIGLASTIMTYKNWGCTSAHPHQMALLFGIIYSAFLLLSGWIILAYFRGRLVLTGNTMVLHGIFRSKTMAFTDIVSLDWRDRPVSGSIVVRTSAAKAVVYLDNFMPEERTVIIRILYESIPPEAQCHWSRFEESLRRITPPPKAFSRDGIIITISVLVLGAGALIYCWFTGLGGRFLLIGMINLIAALWYLWRLRA